MTCVVRKRIGLLRLIAVFCAAFLVLPGLSLHAASGSRTSSEVSITVAPVYGEYRYSMDILFYSMEFTYHLLSIACNEETGEVYVNSGEWQMSGNAVESVTLTVVNHSDTPVLVTSRADASELVRCGIDVGQTGLSGEYLPACQPVPNAEALVSEGEMTLTLEGYPKLDAYAGIKTIYVTVRVDPAAGFASNGEEYTPFCSP